jgi:hypothetical protein
MLKEAEHAFRCIGNDYMVGMCIVEKGYVAIEHGESVLDVIYHAKQISKTGMTRSPEKLKKAVEELLTAAIKTNRIPMSPTCRTTHSSRDS